MNVDLEVDEPGDLALAAEALRAAADTRRRAVDGVALELERRRQAGERVGPAATRLMTRQAEVQILGSLADRFEALADEHKIISGPDPAPATPPTPAPAPDSGEAGDELMLSDDELAAAIMQETGA